MRICFHWLNLATPPGMSVGVSLLSRLLAEAGHDVHVLHLNERVGLPFDLPLILAQPEVRAAELHALSFGQNHAELALQLATSLKAAFPRARILCGGIHSTLNADEVLAHPAVDFVGLGEVDETLVHFIARLAAGGENAQVPGFWVKEKGRVLRTHVPPLPDLRRPGLPFFDGIDYSRIIEANRGFAQIIAGRGCALRCRYCHNDALVKTLRRHSAEPLSRQDFCRQRPVAHVIEELEEYRRRFPTVLRAFSFSDDTFAGSLPWVRAFSEAYRARVGLPFDCNAIPEQMDEVMARLLADAECNLVRFGVESGSERVRREVLGRHLSEHGLAKAVSTLGAVGVNTRAYVILGAPGETAAEMAKTVSLCAALRFDSVRPAIFTPYPGTSLHRHCEELGLILPGQIITDYSTTTVLNLPAPERTHIEQTAALYAWLLNQQLGGGAAEAAQALVEEIRSLTGPAWSVAEGRRRIAAHGAEAHAALTVRGIEHYHAPFSDRPDVIFLYRRRPRPFVNVDDGVNTW